MNSLNTQGYRWADSAFRAEFCLPQKCWELKSGNEPEGLANMNVAASLFVENETVGCAIRFCFEKNKIKSDGGDYKAVISFHPLQ